ncbi:YARHG domain-containing protein [Anabaena sp. UHCC 0204]|uniref:protein kinase domain-containing protein n=1 Tax=Anabaena sp. UHCC 0204 TaxID=2590009 RepID=UPI001447C00E|nr:YARHG domain-containing protein [Anabaena sp. UHCC 0204]MTJ09906.1 YARHG domain-containing protein [Anabaena sp. UHCC 0204]
MQTLLNNRYQVIRTLGSGGFGETFLATDSYMPSKRLCVVKQLKPIQNNHQIYQLVQDRFQREAAILETLGGHCDQIPALYAYFCADGQFYLVQEWIEGNTLTKEFQKQGLFTETVVREILINILPVLDYIHSEHIVHRDIKPDNIILRHHDGKPVLIDFGAVRESMGTVMNSQGNPTSSIVIGTPGFMSSEQAAGRPIYSSDLYSLGLTAIFLLTGKRPQKLETDSQTGEVLWRHYIGNLDPTIARVIDKAIAYHPRDRYPTAKAMLAALQSPINSSFTTPAPSLITNFISTLQESTISYPVNSPVNSPVNTQKTILMGSLIAGGLVGVSVIISQLITQSFKSTTKTEVSISTTRTMTTPSVQDSPVTLPILQPPLNITPTNPELISPILPSETNTNVDNYAWLSQRPVTDVDLFGKNGYQLDIMRNTIFAIYGRRFEDPSLQDYFNKQSWYIPQYTPEEFPMKLLSKLEMDNIAYIDQYQNRYQLRHFPNKF